MFPNDDICNVKAAKDAARRIFEKYGKSVQSQSNSEGLGQKQVSSLIKNAYTAIDIPYDPSNQDVFSFMSVFGADKDGKIQLKQLEQLAIKYLCGEQALNMNFKQRKETQQQKTLKEKHRQKEQKTISSNNELSVQKQNNIAVNVTTQKQTNVRTSNISNIGFLSPKANISKDFNFGKYVTMRQQKSKGQDQNVKGNISYSYLLNEANKIFNLNKSKQKEGITLEQASVVLTQSYQLIGRKKYNPSQEDVKIWMKLCDTKNNGVVDWFSYENFIKRLLQRQNIRED